MKYNVKLNQTGIDIVTNLFGNQDYVSNLYLDNSAFDINKMQNELELEYTPITSTVITEINNYEYTFANGDIEIFKNILTFEPVISKLNKFTFIIFNDSTTLNVDYRLKRGDLYVYSDSDPYIHVNESIELDIDSSYYSEIIFKEINFNNTNLISLSPVDLKISKDFILNINGSSSLTDFNFLEKFTLLNVSSGLLRIYAREVFDTNDNANDFVDLLLQSDFSKNPGILYLKTGDGIPNNSSWSTLGSLGWQYNISA